MKKLLIKNGLVHDAVHAEAYRADVLVADGKIAEIRADLADAALQAITINPAKHIGVEDRVGSLEVGKDGDIVIADGNPMLSGTRILYTVIDGEIRYDGTEDRM